MSLALSGILGMHSPTISLFFQVFKDYRQFFLCFGALTQFFHFLVLSFECVLRYTGNVSEKIKKNKTSFYAASEHILSSPLFPIRMYFNANHIIQSNFYGRSRTRHKVLHKNGTDEK